MFGFVHAFPITTWSFIVCLWASIIVGAYISYEDGGMRDHFEFLLGWLSNFIFYIVILVVLCVFLFFTEYVMNSAIYHGA